MKKLFMALLFIAAISFTAKAQVPEKSPEQRAAHMTKTLSKALNLTADQSSKINAIIVARISSMDSLKTNPPANKKTDNLDKREIQLTADEKIMGVLTADQQKQYLQWEADQKQKREEKKNAPQQTTPAASTPALTQG